ncbi:MAG TPA: hypothetical protein PLP95_04720, partial [Microthrixaceae bacterium]|nr:hypothetical protein [Microthrixaceae bacterium]
TVAARLRGQQQTGIVRTDVDPDALADGSVGIILSVLMAVLQFGPMAISTFGPGIVAMFDAALLPPEA